MCLIKFTSCLIIAVATLFSAKILSGQTHPVIKFEEATDKGAVNCGQTIEGIQVPEHSIVPMKISPVYLTNKQTQQTIQSDEILKNAQNKSVLFGSENAVYIINTADQSITYQDQKTAISQTAIDALNQVPLWLYDQLKLKFILLARIGVDDDMAQYILDAPENQKDEVAFIIAYTSYQTLTSSNFLSNKNLLKSIPEFIYKVDDSLHYVDKVEYGTYAARDYYTTTKYRVYDPIKKDTIWSEIPKEMYYFYIVCPKMDQEAVLVRDNGNDNSGMRTYGYDWRNFIWDNPDPAHNYQNVNITTTKGTVSTIPRFGELMQKPRILWNRNKTYMTFGRPFKDNDYALDLIGNWASKAVPVDVQLPRAFQPNQILIKHNGNCNEDAPLVTAACRTALIPAVQLGTWSQDHVFSSVWDQDWNHFEFFRGGLAPSGNEFYGITNMLDRGSYGWKNAYVEGFRPDGFPGNFTKYYADTCKFIVNVTDSLGNPIEGVRLTLYAAPSAYSANPALAGRVWTDYNGTAVFPAGSEKTYLVQAYHPTYKWSPADSTKAYYLAPSGTVSNQSYTVNLLYPNVKIKAYWPSDSKTPLSGKYGIRAKWNVTDILSDINPHDSQNSRFYLWNDPNKGEISFFICDSLNYEKYKKREQFNSYSFYQYTKGGDFSLALPGEGKWYVVFSNHNFASMCQFLATDISLIKDITYTSAEDNTDDETVLSASPNPFSDYLAITGSRLIKSVKVYNNLGMKICDLQAPFVWKPAEEVQSGVYYLTAETDTGVKVKKVIYTK